jgi:hypothetical protein
LDVDTFLLTPDAVPGTDAGLHAAHIILSETVAF